MDTLMEIKREQTLNGRSNTWLKLIAQIGEQLSACEQQSDEQEHYR